MAKALQLKDRPTVFIDVDDTLIMWKYPEHWDDTIKISTYGDVSYEVAPHRGHIEVIKQFKARGHNVVIWSAGGSNWAKAVVDALKLNRYVNAIMPKPFWYYDDLEVDEWIGKRYYYEFGEGAEDAGI